VLPAVALVVAIWAAGDRARTEQLVNESRAALQAKDFESALQLAESALSREPESTAALLTAGEAAVRLGRLDAAFAYFARLPEETAPLARNQANTEWIFFERG
jgi:thioredoxin-like negative regulator of GroEL